MNSPYALQTLQTTSISVGLNRELCTTSLDCESRAHKPRVDCGFAVLRGDVGVVAYQPGMWPIVYILLNGRWTLFY